MVETEPDSVSAAESEGISLDTPNHISWVQPTSSEPATERFQSLWVKTLNDKIPSLLD
jgi:hypothetical protein